MAFQAPLPGSGSRAPGALAQPGASELRSVHGELSGGAAGAWDRDAVHAAARGLGQQGSLAMGRQWDGDQGQVSSLSAPRRDLGPQLRSAPAPDSSPVSFPEEDALPVE